MFRLFCNVRMASEVKWRYMQNNDPNKLKGSEFKFNSVGRNIPDADLATNKNKMSAREKRHMFTVILLVLVALVVIYLVNSHGVIGVSETHPRIHRRSSPDTSDDSRYF